MRLAELEKQRSYRLITDIVTDLKSSAYGDIFTDFSDKGLDNLMDSMIVSRFNSYELREDQELEFADGILADVSISTYLMEKAIYIRQQLAYEAAEYNPIENYSQMEHEETTFDGGARAGSGYVNKGSELDTYLNVQREDKVITADHVTQNDIKQRKTTNDIKQRKTTTNSDTKVTRNAAGERVTTTDIGARSRTTQSAPFESSSFYNEHKESDAEAQDQSVVDAVTDTITQDGFEDVVTEDPHVDVITEDPHLDIITDKAHTDTYQTGPHTDTITYGARTDFNNHSENAYQDSTERTLTRSGNIGVQTAAQMMSLDREYWSNNTWIRGLVLGIVALTCETWEAV